jgi:hypothetical protein
VNKLIGIVGDVAAVVGILVCVLSGAARLVGTYGIAGVGTAALFMFGIGIMVFACLAKLHLLTMRAKGG